MMRVSCCVHSYNEGEALRRLVRSSFPMADRIAEWVVLDHRSDDATQAVCRSLLEECRALGMSFRVLREARDFSRTFTFADLRTATLRACRAPIAVLHDADFILGPGFAAFLDAAVPQLSVSGSQLYGASFTVPVIWDHLATDAQGRITDHGRVWVHSRRARIFWRTAVRYTQTKRGGRWEQLVVAPGLRQGLLPLTTSKELPQDAVVSVNVKPAERIALRGTMTAFMEDAVKGRTRATWLTAHKAGAARTAYNTYEFLPLDLRGWQLHAPNLKLAA